MRILVRNVSGAGLASQAHRRALERHHRPLPRCTCAAALMANELRRSTHHALGARHAAAGARLPRLPGVAARARDCPTPARDRVDSADEEARLHARAARARRAHRRATWSACWAARRSRPGWTSGASPTPRRSCAASRRARWSDELEALVAGGARERNRWVWRQHLRVLRAEGQGRDLVGGRGAVSSSASWRSSRRSSPRLLGSMPSPLRVQPGRRLTRSLTTSCRDHAAPIFRELDLVRALITRGDYMATFRAVGTLRRRLDTRLDEGAFPEQRYLLHQLDCLLEEMGFLALRHVASRYEEQGVRLSECLEIIHGCAGSLSHDGLLSRELWDLSSMLVDRARSGARAGRRAAGHPAQLPPPDPARQPGLREHGRAARALARRAARDAGQPAALPARPQQPGALHGPGPARARRSRGAGRGGPGAGRTARRTRTTSCTCRTSRTSAPASRAGTRARTCSAATAARAAGWSTWPTCACRRATAS